MPHSNRNRPSPQAVQALFSIHQYDAVGRLLRLALWAGLVRQELVALQWQAVKLADGYVAVGHRQIPLSPQLSAYLGQCPGQHQGFVVASSRNTGGISAQSASHLMRQALDSVGQQGVRLTDLRAEYIINALQTTPWEQVCQQMDITHTTLVRQFAPYLPEKISLKNQSKAVTLVNSQQIQGVLTQSANPVVTLAIALAWYMGITLQEMVALTWGAVQGDCLVLPERTVPIHPWVQAYFQTLPAKGAECPVLVGPKAGKALPLERVSRLVRQEFLRQGISHVTLRDVLAAHAHGQNGSDAIVTHLQLQGKATTAQLAQLLGLEPSVAYKQLLRLVKQGQVVKVGALYYHPTAVVACEQHRLLVEGRLAEFGRLYRKDVVDLLGITPNQASVLLKKWVQEGWLVQEKQSYLAP